MFMILAKFLPSWRKLMIYLGDKRFTWVRTDYLLHLPYDIEDKVDVIVSSLICHFKKSTRNLFQKYEPQMVSFKKHLSNKLGSYYEILKKLKARDLQKFLSQNMTECILHKNPSLCAL